MNLYLTLITNKKLSQVPLIDSITVSVRGVPYTCTWEESDGVVWGKTCSYTFKDISLDDTYVEGLIDRGERIFFDEDNIDFMEDDMLEEFSFTITEYSVSDNSLRQHQLIHPYVVTVNNCYVRDTQVFQPDNEDFINADDFINYDIHTNDNDWKDIDAELFLGIIRALHPEQALKIAEQKFGRNKKLLCAKEVK